MLVIDYNKCSGCRRCESFCSFFHTGSVGHMGARIKVEKIESIGIDFPIVCHQCKEHYCTRCPEDAVSITERGSIEVSPTLCTLCGTCERLCPVGAIEIYNDIPYVCDLCGGDPRCIKACEMDAIRFEPDVRQAVSLADVKKKVKKMTPSQKRFAYAMSKSGQIRDAWLEKRRNA